MVMNGKDGGAVAPPFLLAFLARGGARRVCREALLRRVHVLDFAPDELGGIA